VHLITNGPVRAALIPSDGIQAGSLEPRTITLMPRGSRHRLVTEDPILTVSVALHPELLSRALDQTAASAAHRADAPVESCRSACHVDASSHFAPIWRTAHRGRLNGESLGTALAVYLARPLQRHAAGDAAACAADWGHTDFARSWTTSQLIWIWIQDLSLAALARTAGMSPHHFAALFRQRMGIPPHRYVVEQRIERARQLLRIARDPSLRSRC